MPIVPAAIFGTDRLMPYGSVVPRHAHQQIMVRFGRPVTVEELTGGVKGSDGSNAALPVLNGLPDRSRTDSDRSQHSDSGDNYSALQGNSQKLLSGYFFFDSM